MPAAEAGQDDEGGGDEGAEGEQAQRPGTRAAVEEGGGAEQDEQAEAGKAAWPERLRTAPAA